MKLSKLRVQYTPLVPNFIIGSVKFDKCVYRTYKPNTSISCGAMTGEFGVYYSTRADKEVQIRYHRQIIAKLDAREPHHNTQDHQDRDDANVYDSPSSKS
jgi:hypothetical protein